MSSLQRHSTGLIPNGWARGSMVDATLKIADRDHFTPTYVEHGVPMVSPKDFDGHDRIDFSTCQYITEEAHQRNRKKTDINAGDIVFTRIGARLGKACLVTAEMPEFSLLHSAVMVRADRRKSLPEFLVYVFKGEEIQGQIGKEIQSIGVPDLGLDKINAFVITLPPLPEQRKIARILTTVDRLIEKTEALIAKYQAVKQGMMHDLFTRGVDAHGQLRPPQTEAPELYKQSELGWVPREWEVDHLLRRVTLPQGQVDPRRAPYRDWVLIAPDHIEQRTGRLIGRETAAQQNAISGKYEFDSGDVLYSKIRPYLRKAVLANEKGICSADMYPMRPGLSVRPRFLLGMVLGESFSRFAESVSERSGFPKINRTELAEYVATFPRIGEQDRICSILLAGDRRLHEEERNLAKCRLLKTGLMQDLLTGKVRVKVDEEDNQDG